MKSTSILCPKKRFRMNVLAMAALCIALIGLRSTADAQTYDTLYSYPGTNNNTSGITWPGLMAQGQDGEYYGTDQTNGTYNAGSVYKISTNGAYMSLYSFCAEGGHCLTTGANPAGGVTLGTDGNYYGTTQGGGAYGAGIVFKITPAGVFTKLWDFTESKTTQHLTDEGAPYYPLLLGQDANFYGTDTGQYNTDYGVFYKITSKGALTPHAFSYTNGAFPNLPTQSTDGNFYGTTLFGGDPTCRCGVAYKATAAGKITVLHIFKGGALDGNKPTGQLVQGNDGNFYGTTYFGGTKNVGTVFKITPTGTFTLLHSFSGGGTDGTYPETGLTLASDGSFYGTTANGGKVNAGTIYKITSTGTTTLLYNFCAGTGCAVGIYPATPIMQHTDGKFYGNTNGNSLGGSVFYSFNTGLQPFSKLVIWKGKVAAKIGILGQGFTGASSVKFNGAAATFTVVSDTYITAVVPAAAKTGSVTVTTSAGTLTSNHTFMVVPTIKSIAPTTGPVGTSVVVTGTGFTGATKVTVGGKVATFTVNSASQITTTVPTGAKTGKIVVATPGGSATSATTFTVTM